MEKSEISSNEFKTPEGGWGYVIIAAFIIMNWVSLIPFVIFPLLYGDHLARLGDEASQTAMAIQVFMGLVSLASCFAGFSISRYGYRITGLSGAISFLIGALGEHFGTSFAHIIIFTSVFKGTGFGLMEMSSITILNVYFDKNLNFAMGICQVFIAIGTIAGPPQTTFLIGTIGVKNTIWIYTGLSLLNFPAMATFRPVTSHKERDPIASLPYEEGKTAAQAPLLQVDKENELDVGRVTKMWNSTKTWILDDFGFRLFMRLKFWIITVGLGVAYISDVLFYHLIRATLKSLNFTPEDISLSMMIFIVTDICGRLGYTILSRFWTLKNSYIFLTASIFINACRIN